MKKLYKKITKNNSTIKFYGANRWVELRYDHTPEWADDPVASFTHYRRRYFIDEFMVIDENAPEYMQEFNGYDSSSFFSGVVIKLSNNGEKVKAFTYIS